MQPVFPSFFWGIIMLLHETGTGVMITSATSRLRLTLQIRYRNRCMTEYELTLDFIWMGADGRDMVGNGDDLSNALAANFSRIYCSNFETFSSVGMYGRNSGLLRCLVLLQLLTLILWDLIPLERKSLLVKCLNLNILFD